jgi:hypothetical protein
MNPLHATIEEFAADGYTQVEGSRVNALYVVMMRTSVMEIRKDPAMRARGLRLKEQFVLRIQASPSKRHPFRRQLASTGFRGLGP